MEPNHDDILANAVRRMVEAVCETLRTPPQPQRGLFETLSGADIPKGPTRDPSVSLDPEGPESPIIERAWVEVEAVLWEQLALHSNPRVQAEVAMHQPLALHVFQKLAEHPDYLVRWSLVLNPELPPALLPVLAKDPADFVRREVARHPDTDRETLDSLAQDPILQVRLAVVANARTTWTTLERMMAEASDLMQRAIARHPNNPNRLRYQEWLFRGQSRNPRFTGIVPPPFPKKFPAT